MAKKSGKAVSKKSSAKAKAPAAAKKPAAKKAAAKPRKLKQPQYKTFRLQKRIKHPVKLPNVYRLTRSAALLLWEHKGLFAGITLVYGLLNLVLVQGIAGNGDVTTLKHTLDEVFTGNLGSLVSGLSLFTMLVGSAGNASSETAGAYQAFLAIIGSLAIIWALRQVSAGSGLRVRDPYYRGMYPLIPFMLVLLVIGLQLIPFIIGASIYGLVINNGIAVLFVEKLLWGILYALFALLTLYMVSSSIFALYIVTLPEMTPMKALRSARGLVRHRRWTVLRKIVALPVILLVTAAIIMVPIIIWLTAWAQWTFFILTMTALLAVHAYMYTLYRELLNE